MTAIGLIGVLVVQGVVLVIMVTVGYLLFEGVRGVPLIPTRRSLANDLFELAELSSDDRLVDLGSGSGDIVLEAAGRCQQAHGIERVGLYVRLAQWRAKRRGVEGNTSFFVGDIFTAELPEADVVTCYLFTEVNAKLEPRLRELYPVGTRIVSRSFPFPTLPLVREIRVGNETLFLYRID